MKLSILFISLLWTITSAGQTLTEIKQLLVDRDFLAFKKYVDTASARYNKANPGGDVRAIWGLRRDLTPYFQEATVDIEQFFPREDKPGVSRVFRFRINLIATDREIIYYDFAEKNSKSPSWNDFELQVLDSARTQVQIDSLNTSYLAIYKIPLNRTQLFDEKNVYGFRCSIDGQEPDMRLELEILLAKRDYKELNNWLTSPNAERQVYAIEGYYQLKKKGYRLTMEQKRIINVIKEKKGEVSVCRGCIYSSDQIGYVVKQIIAGRRI